MLWFFEAFFWVVALCSTLISRKPNLKNAASIYRYVNAYVLLPSSQLKHYKTHGYYCTAANYNNTKIFLQGENE